MTQHLRIFQGCAAVIGIFAGMAARPAEAQYRLDFFDAPGAATTFARGINNLGQVAGTYTDANFETAGFLYDGTGFTTVRVPGAFSTELNGINDSGAIVGTYVAADFSGHGFQSNSAGIVDMEFPGAASTTPTSLNNQGAIVGTYTELGGSQSHGFVLNGNGFTAFDAPGNLPNILDGGINDAGSVAGTYFDHGFHGYLLDGGTFTTLDAPGLTDTFVSDINNHGDIVGFFEPGVGSSRTGFVLRGGQRTTLDIPGATFTNLMGINDAGTIVGYYADANDLIHGFTATPVPEPTTALMLTAAVLSGGLSVGRARNRRQRRVQK